MRKQKFRAFSLLLAALMLSLTVLPVSAATTASTMQLTKTTGTVSVTNSSGRSISQRDNMHLYNGYHVKTEAKSYAWIKLESEKLTKLDAELTRLFCRSRCWENPQTDEKGEPGR